MISDKSIISGKAKISKNVIVADFAKIGDNVILKEGVTIGHGAVIERNTTIGEGTKISPYAVIGTAPQDLKFGGEQTYVEIGKNCTIREYVTVNRGTVATGKTVIGDNTLLMAYAHIAHDCRVGSNCVIAAQFAGHVSLEDHVIIGGMSAVHQFVKIGSYSIIGGASRVTQDIPPYTMVAGSPATLYGLNMIGLKRADFSQETINLLKKALKILFRSELRRDKAIEEVLKMNQIPEIRHMVEFVKNSDRGTVSFKRGAA